MLIAICDLRAGCLTSLFSPAAGPLGNQAWRPMLARFLLEGKITYAVGGTGSASLPSTSDIVKLWGGEGICDGLCFLKTGNGCPVRLCQAITSTPLRRKKPLAMTSIRRSSGHPRSMFESWRRMCCCTVVPASRQTRAAARSRGPPRECNAGRSPHGQQRRPNHDDSGYLQVQGQRDTQSSAQKMGDGRQSSGEAGQVRSKPRVQTHMGMKGKVNPPDNSADSVPPRNWWSAHCVDARQFAKISAFRQSLSAYQPDWHICVICEFHSNHVCNLCSQAVLSGRARCIICNFSKGLHCFSMTKCLRCLARTRRSNSANAVPPIQGRLRFATLWGKHLSAASCKFLAGLCQPRAWPRVRPGSQLSRVIGTQPIATAVDGRRPRHMLHTQFLVNFEQRLFGCMWCSHVPHALNHRFVNQTCKSILQSHFVQQHDALPSAAADDCLHGTQRECHVPVSPKLPPWG